MIFRKPVKFELKLKAVMNDNYAIKHDSLKNYTLRCV